MSSSPSTSDTANEALAEEISSINAIYGHSTLTTAIPHTSTSSNSKPSTTLILHLPNNASSVLLSLPASYPSTIPTVLGSHSSGIAAGDTSSNKRGSARRAVQIIRETLHKVWREGEVCMFDLIEEASAAILATEQEEDAAAAEGERHQEAPDDKDTGDVEEMADVYVSTKHRDTDSLLELGEEPPWTLSDPVTEKKSVFLARAAPVTSKALAESYIAHLLSTNKKVASATHNITAYRIRGAGNADVVIQDCDDDGETAAGGRLLRLLQLMDVWDILVVVTRWYGGVKLGPARFGIINACGRGAIVKAGILGSKPGEGEDDGSEKKKKEGKKKKGSKK